MNRYRNRRFAALITGLVALCSSLPAQYVPSMPSRPFPGYINEYLRKQDVYLSQWDIGVNVRGRVEVKDNAGFTYAGQNADFRGGGAVTGVRIDNDNSYFLTRIMPRVGYTDKWYSFLVEARSSESYDDERGDIRADLTAAQKAQKKIRGFDLAENDRDLNLHQAFIMVGNHKEFPVSMKIGRQELVYGDQRLVGHLRWNNNARVFDAAKLRYQNRYFGADVFYGGLVYNDNGNFNQSHIQDDAFSGVYLNFPNIGDFTQKNIVEAYYLNRDVERSSARVDVTKQGANSIPYSGVALPFRNPAIQDLSTIGLRLKSKPLAYGGWDYGAEVMHQFGTINNQNPTAPFGAVIPGATSAAILAARERDQDAYAAIVGAGYTWTDYAWQPRTGFVYSYASGDTNAADGKSGTFQNMFATTHLHYGFMDLNSLQNLHDFRLVFQAKPSTNISFSLEHHFQFLATTNDYWYNVGGVPRNGGGYADSLTRSNSNQLGQETDFVVSWNPIPSTQLELGVSHYFRGDYIKQTLSNDVGGSKDASYAYFQVTLSL
jgi:Alginate export